MVFSFFTTLPPKGEEQEITNRAEIAKSYLTTWFPIELLSIIPVDLITSVLVGRPAICNIGAEKCIRDCGEPNANVFLRFPRILKLARLIRIIRMLKVMKLVKNKEHL